MFIGVCVGLLFLVSFTYKVSANPLGFQNKQSATATSTVSWMQPGLATSTLYFDTQNGGTSATGADAQTLLVQFGASSTASTLQINQEYSQGIGGVDCVATPLQCDWYEGTSPFIVGNAATTTNPIAVDVNLTPQYSWKFASSTIGGQPVSTTNATSTRAIPFVSPTRYVRFVFSLKIATNGNGNVWAQVVAKKQNP